MTQILGNLRWQVVDQDTGEVQAFLVPPMMDLDAYDNDALIKQLVGLEGLQALLGDRYGRMEHELTRRLDLDEATEYVGPDGSVKLEDYGISYDPLKLDRLLEVIPESELIESKALVPAHEERTQVDRKWNVVKVKKFAKRGKEPRQIIEGARVIKGQRVKVKVKAD